ncbi:PKD domain-containing protein [Candidatus Omnitrophota bacterium]
MKYLPIIAACAYLLFFSPSPIEAQTIKPLRTAVDLDIGETQQAALSNGKTVSVTVLDVVESRDIIRDAIREARVKVRVDGEEITLVSANYNLPKKAGTVKIDCPITKGYNSNTTRDAWGLKKDVRLRLWPSESPFAEPGTIVYPVNQRLFASDTQMSNEPVFVDAGENPGNKNIYYHDGLDFGGAEGMVDVFAATYGLVVSKAGAILDGHEKDTPVGARYDVIYLLDDRGWYYRYSHLKSHETNVRLGERVKAGQKIGELGKEGGSGGWSHFHFAITCRQPSGAWGTEEGYAYIHEAYLNQYNPPLIALARPHLVAAVGETVTLDGSKSQSFGSAVSSHSWKLSNGESPDGAVQTIVYDRPGVYSEILKVVTDRGDVDYDFAVVNVIDKKNPDKLPPTLHAAYSPTFGIQAGDPVTFKVRAFRTGVGKDIWDFGDGSPHAATESKPGDQHLPDGYAAVVHRFEKAGYYIVRVEREGEHGYKAVCHLDVMVGNGK